MFRGVNPINLDVKGRLAIPTKYRDRLRESCAGQLVVTVDRDHCLLLYPLAAWEEIERQLVRLGNMNKQVRRLQRLLIGHASECEMDGNGRILMPPALREFAGLNKRVVLIGQGNKFELWDEQIWNDKREEWLSGDDDSLDIPPELDSLSL